MRQSLAKNLRRDLRRSMGDGAVNVVEELNTQFGVLDVAVGQAIENLRKDIAAMEVRLTQRINERSMP